ncbi:glycosyltransferase family 4 protein [Scytonema sp. NUACC26]|uniref:glycosyltransferase family 4 protein n=1 Tax=Scytonema sp. NUACC26 TaxID=3140176 RepID=UPI0034DCAFAE
MRVLVTSSARFAILKDGTLWTSDPSVSYKFWSRYLDVYDEVHLLVRATAHDVPQPGWKMSSGSGIKPVPLPNYRGVWQYAKNYHRVKQIIHEAIANVEAVHLRIPCEIGGMVQHSLENSRPYGVEVIGDPYDVFAPEAYKHPLRPAFRWWFTRQLQQQCQQATATAYVTREALQRRYPPNAEAFSTHFSSIHLPTSDFVTESRLSCPVAPYTLISVGTLTQLYKAPDIVIDAIAICVQQGLDLQLVWVGDGKYKQELEARTQMRGLSKRVSFCGQLNSREEVIKQLDRADLFVLPSRQEGLPRAIIEAMARGLPCIGSSVGGFAELLLPEEIVPPNDVASLAAKISEILVNPQRMAVMSARNLEKAQNYRDDILRQRRMKFYQYVRDRTQEWLTYQSYPQPEITCL